MKYSLVILFAVIVAVSSAADLPEGSSRLPLDKLEPVLQKFIDHFHKVKNVATSEDDVFENGAKIDAVSEVNDSLEEFRKKPMNLKAVLEKMEEIEKKQQIASELSDMDDEEDVFLSNGLDKPVKFDDVKQEKESDEDEEEEETESKVVPISSGVVEEAVDMTKENPDVQISYGLADPIESFDLKKNAPEEEEDDDDEDNESVIPIREIKEEEPVDDDNVMISFGLDEPIEAAAVRKINLQADADDEDDEEDEDKPSDLNEKIMSEIISSVIQKFAKVHGVKL